MWKVSFKKRVWAYIIDICICTVLSYYLIEWTNLDDKLVNVEFIGLLLVTKSVVLFIYLTLFYFVFNGTSIGRALFGMHLVSNSGKLKLIQIIIRSFMQAIIVILPINLIYQYYHHTEISIYNQVSDSHFDYFKKKEQ